jgi:flavodoxin I
MKILILFATYSYGTQTVSDAVREFLTGKGHDVLVKHINDASPKDVDGYDLTILASPSWDYEGVEGQPHEGFISFIKQSENISMQGKKFAIVGLGDSTYAHFCGAVDHLEAFVKKTNGTLVHPSLRIDKFYFNQEENLQKLNAWLEDLQKTVVG